MKRSPPLLACLPRPPAPRGLRPWASHRSSTAASPPSGLLSSAGTAPVSARADHVMNAPAVPATASRAEAAHSAADSADSGPSRSTQPHLPDASGEPMDVVFAVVPFADVARPAIGVSLLKAELARVCSASVQYLNLDFAAAIGSQLYQHFCHNVPAETMPGEWFFSCP